MIQIIKDNIREELTKFRFLIEVFTNPKKSFKASLGMSQGFFYFLIHVVRSRSPKRFHIIHIPPKHPIGKYDQLSAKDLPLTSIPAPPPPSQAAWRC